MILLVSSHLPIPDYKSIRTVPEEAALAASRLAHELILLRKLAVIVPEKL